jgi:hypothetical protein
MSLRWQNTKTLKIHELLDVMLLHFILVSTELFILVTREQGLSELQIVETLFLL